MPRQLYPGLVHESRRVQGGVGMVGAHLGREPPQLVVGGGEEAVELGAIDLGHDGSQARLTQGITTGVRRVPNLPRMTLDHGSVPMRWPLTVACAVVVACGGGGGESF